MSLFAVAAWLVGVGCGAIIAMGLYAIAIDRLADHPQTYGVCTPNRGRMLTGANQERAGTLRNYEHMIRVREQQIDALERRCEELEDQLEIVPLADDSRLVAEVERLQTVIRQRNRTIKQLRAQLEERPVERPATTGTVDRFAHLEIRGQSW